MYSAAIACKHDEAEHNALLLAIERLKLRDLDELPRAIWGNKELQDLPAILQSQPLASIVGNFVSSINRCAGPSDSFRESFLHGAQLWLNIIQFNLENKGMGKPGCYSVRQAPALADEFVSFVRQKRSHPVAISSFEEAIEWTPNGISLCMTLMATQVTSAWTALETLFADVWDLVLSGSSSSRLGAKGSVIKKEDFYSARLEKKRGIRDAYATVFHDGGAAIQKEIGDDSITALFAIRNLITHKAGRCDEKYLEYARRLSSIPQLALDEVLTLDGAVMRRTMLPALATTMRLIHELDSWLVNHA
jgi:hypothetical protein